jgi:hypothetical protein
MEPNETPLERAKRRVAEAEARVKDQAVRVAELARMGLDTTQAKATLAVFETTLQMMREDLAREQERSAGDQQ